MELDERHHESPTMRALQGRGEEDHVQTEVVCPHSSTSQSPIQKAPVSKTVSAGYGPVNGTESQPDGWRRVSVSGWTGP